MQRWFLRHNNYDSVIYNCEFEINHAVESQANIIFLYYKGAGKVISKLTRLVSGYKNVSFIGKDIEDGSSWVKEILDNKKIIPRLMKITGVQTDMCVHNTVEGLCALYPKTRLHVVSSACGAIYDNAHINGLRAIGKFSNTVIV